MGAAVVRREQLNVLVMLAATDLVLDAVVREMYLAIEVRQVVLARPVNAARRRSGLGGRRYPIGGGCGPAGTPGTRA